VHIESYWTSSLASASDSNGPLGITTELALHKLLFDLRSGSSRACTNATVSGDCYRDETSKLMDTRVHGLVRDGHMITKSPVP